MVRQRVSPREYERYRQDPERPALLQALRAHEIGGRSIEDSLDAITAEPLAGLRSIAAGLHGRLGKAEAPPKGETKTWAERAPQNAPEPVREAAAMLDARQAALGRQLAERPPQWALEAWGVPPPEPGALRSDWERRAAIVGSYREAAGVTDPAQAISPVPSGQAQLREAFHASVVALELPDDQAMLRATGRGQLKATVAGYDRAAALAPPDVQAQIGEREHAWEGAQARAHTARYSMDAEAAAEADAQGADAAAELADLRVADAARREWAEAHAGGAEAARAAEGELQRRDQAERVSSTESTGNAEARPESWPMPDAEFMAYLDEIVAADATRKEAAAAAEAGAGRDQQQPGRELQADGQADVYAEIHEDLQQIGRHIDELSAQMDAEDVRRTEAQQEMLNEPVPWHQPQAQAQAALEPSWQPGEAVAVAAEAEAGMEAEI